MKGSDTLNFSRDQLYEMIYKMQCARIFEQSVNEMFMRGMIHGTTHLSVGQEACAVGAIAAIREDDLIMSNHRGHSHCIAKGMDLKRMMCELFGKEPGVCKGLGGSMHMVDVESGNYGANGVIGPAISIATGIALAVVKDGSDKVVLDFFGDGTSNTGNFHEALNIASLWKLPIVYICENNLYGMGTSVEASISVENIADRASAYGIPGVIADGNDVFAVANAVGRAVERARKGEGPTLLELKTYRWMGHSKSDKRAYRTRDEENEWKAHCPIRRFSDYLLENGFTEDELHQIELKVQAEVNEAANYAMEAPIISMEEARTLVFA